MSAKKPKKSLLNREFKRKPRAFLIFTDLDGTFTPIGIKVGEDGSNTAVWQMGQRFFFFFAGPP